MDDIISFEMLEMGPQAVSSAFASESQPARGCEPFFENMFIADAPSSDGPAIIACE